MRTALIGWTIFRLGGTGLNSKLSGLNNKFDLYGSRNRWNPSRCPQRFALMRFDQRVTAMRFAKHNNFIYDVVPMTCEAFRAATAQVAHQKTHTDSAYGAKDKWPCLFFASVSSLPLVLPVHVADKVAAPTGESWFASGDNTSDNIAARAAYLAGMGAIRTSAESCVSETAKEVEATRYRASGLAA